MVKWLKEKGCSFDEHTYNYALGNGNVENIQWLNDNGCPH